MTKEDKLIDLIIQKTYSFVKENKLVLKEIIYDYSLRDQYVRFSNQSGSMSFTFIIYPDYNIILTEELTNFEKLKQLFKRGKKFKRALFFKSILYPNETIVDYDKFIDETLAYIKTNNIII